MHDVLHVVFERHLLVGERRGLLASPAVSGQEERGDQDHDDRHADADEQGRLRLGRGRSGTLLALAAASDGGGIGLPPSGSLAAAPLSDTLSSHA